MRYLKVMMGLVAVATMAGFGILYSGIANVGAIDPHSAPVRWLLHTGMERSVIYHARDIKAPPLSDPKMILEGFRHYREMCVGCHLAPGAAHSDIRAGLMPEPPVLQRVVKRWRPAELFWIVKHGVRMTAMPAWGQTHSDTKIWAIVAFLEKLPGMTKAQYQQMDKKADKDNGDHHANIDKGKE